MKITANALSVIFSFLTAEETARLSRVSKIFNRAACSQYLWKDYCVSRWLFIRLEGNWKKTFVRKYLAGERMLRGNSKDYKMVPCRAHTDFITKIQCISNYLVSLSQNGQVFVWKQPEYNPILLEGSPAESICEIQEKCLVYRKDGSFQVYNLAEMQVVSAGGLGLQEPRFCILNDWIYAIGLRNSQIFGVAVNTTTNQSLEINYSSRLFPESLTSTHIDFLNNKLYCGFASSIIIWDTKNNLLDSHGFINNSPCNVYTVNNTLIIFRRAMIELYSSDFQLKNSVEAAHLGTSLTGIHNYHGITVVSYYDSDSIHLLNSATLEFAYSIQVKGRINDIYFNVNHFITATSNNSIHVFGIKTAKEVYVLLGGSTNPKTLPKSFVPNPTVEGCSKVLIDNDRIIGVFGNLIRIYHFDLE